MIRTIPCVLAILIAMALHFSESLAEDTVKVGIILPITGDKAKFGEIEKQSFELAPVGSMRSSSIPRTVSRKEAVRCCR